LGAVLKGAIVSMVKYTILASIMPTTVAFIPVNNRAKILYRWNIHTSFIVVLSSFRPFHQNQYHFHRYPKYHLTYICS
jgi:hypothetical protein